MNRRLFGVCIVLVATVLSIDRLRAEGKQASASYPSQLIGVWQGDDGACRLPGNLDSDARMEIKPGKLIDYEQWNEPTVVLQISRQPLAWKIKSRLHIDEHWVDQYEIYILSGSDKGTLTVVDKNRSATYVKCEPHEVPVDQTIPSTRAPTQTKSLQAFEGEWSYRSDCDRGHYVTLYIKNEDGHLVGSWSDGTLVRGSQGRLRGHIDQDWLVIERCSDSDEAGGPALCPEYEKSQGYLVVKDNTLTWYQMLGPEPSEYVVLSKGIKPAEPMEACDEA